MVWLGISAENGAAVYLDIHDIERRSLWGELVYAVSATLGDGQFEAQVLVEIGGSVEITLADPWVSAQQAREFFARVGLERLRQAVCEAVLGMRVMFEEAPASGSRSRSRVVGCRIGGRAIRFDPPAVFPSVLPQVGEPGPLWSARA